MSFYPFRRTVHHDSEIAKNLQVIKHKDARIRHHETLSTFSAVTAK